MANKSKHDGETIIWVIILGVSIYFITQIGRLFVKNVDFTGF